MATFDKTCHPFSQEASTSTKAANERDRTCHFVSIYEQIGALSREERLDYERSLKSFRDRENEYDYARAKGLAEGRAEGLAEGEVKAKLDNAHKMKVKGYPIADIVEITGLTPDEIEKL